MKPSIPTLPTPPTSPSRRPAALGTVLLVAALLAAGCPGTPHESDGRNDVRVGYPREPRSLTFIGKGDLTSERIGLLISDGLVQYDARLELVPQVAESWEVSDDMLTVTFRLRDGVRWHDGRPVTAHDVVFTVDRVLDPASEARGFLSSFQDLDAYEALDDRTLRARYGRPFADMLHAWRMPLLPRHAIAPDEELLTGAFAESPIGCGPFRFLSYEPGQRLTLEANDDYWAGRPRIDRLFLEFIPDDRTGFQALVRGDLDMMMASADVWEDAGRLEDSRLARFAHRTLRTWFIAWNMDGSNPFFTDRRVRTALLHALDRERFAEVVARGLAIPAVTTYTAGTPWAADDLKPLPYDVERAVRLLDAAGWRDADGDGVRERNGRRLEFSLLAASSSQELVTRMTAWVQERLAAVGVRVEIDQLDDKAVRERIKSRQFEAYMGGVGLDAGGDQYDLYHSSQVRPDGFNYAGLADDEVDRLIEEGRTTFDPVRRKEIYDALQHRLVELQPFAFLFHFATPILHDRRLRGIEASPLGCWRLSPGPRAWHWADPEDGS